jgi:TorA maturation chaperone TorD
MASTKTTKKDVSSEDKAKAEIAFVRSQIYRLLSLAFLYPKEEFFKSLRKGSFIKELKDYFSYILVNNTKEITKEMGDNAIEVITALEELISNEFPNRELSYLEEKFVTVFGHTVHKDYPPQGSHYGTGHMFQSSQHLADLAGYYNAFGLEHGGKQLEGLDHISLELEFMYVLTFKEGYAFENDGSEKADVCIKAQKKFMKNEIGSWGSLFAKLLETKGKDEYYTKIGGLLKVFLGMETAFLKVKPRKLKAPDASDSLDESARVRGGMECGHEAIKDSTQVADFIK